MLFFAGPAQVGQTVTYQITGSLSTQATPAISKLVLTWTAPTRLYARVIGSGPSAAVSITRAGDGALSVGSSSAADTANVANLINQLNFPGTMADRLNGSDHAETTLTITPLAAAAASSPAAQQTPAPITVPVNLDLVYADGGSTLIADGNSANRNGPPTSGFGRRGGGMGGPMGGMGGGGWHSRNSDQNGEESTAKAPPIGFALEALFDQTGSLQHATYREYFASTSKGGQPIEETFVIDRVENARQPN